MRYKNLITIACSIVVGIALFWAGGYFSSVELTDKLKEKEAKVIELKKENELLKIDVDTLIGTIVKNNEELDILRNARGEVEADIVDTKLEAEGIECPKSIGETIERMKALGLNPTVRCK